MSGDEVERLWRTRYRVHCRDWDFELELMGEQTKGAMG